VTANEKMATAISYDDSENINGDGLTVSNEYGNIHVRGDRRLIQFSNVKREDDKREDDAHYPNYYSDCLL